MRLLALSLFLAGAASAQEVTLYPGHPDLNTNALTPTDVTRDIRMVEPESQSLGISVETATLNGDVLTLVSRSGPDGSQLDSTRVSWPSLAPLSQNVSAGNNQGSALFSGMEVSGSFGAPDAPQAFELAVPSVPFPSSVLRYIIQALPLDQTGYEATAPVFSPQSRLKDIYLTIEGSETVTLPNGETTEAVAVSAVGGPGGPQKHFVDPDTRQILMSEARAQGMVIQATPVTEAELAELQAQDAAEQAAAEAARAEAARNQITPGDASLIDIEPQNATYAVLLTQPQEQELGSLTITETAENGQITLTSDIQIPAAGQDQQDEAVVASSTLAPISGSQTTPQSGHQLTFADGQMTGTVTRGGETTDVAADLGPAFGPGVSRFLIRSLPLAEGYTTSFTQINSEGEMSPSFITVTGQETYTKPDGSEATVWVVEEKEDDSPDYTYYIDTETRELYKMGFAPQPGVRIEMVIQ